MDQLITIAPYVLGAIFCGLPLLCFLGIMIYVTIKASILWLFQFNLGLEARRVQLQKEQEIEIHHILQRTHEVTSDNYYHSLSSAPRPPRKLELPAWVYIISDSKGTYKIGIANDPLRRLTQLQTGHPSKLSILLLLKGSTQLEKELHQRFSTKRIQGEWFMLTNEDIVQLQIDFADNITLLKDKNP